MLKRALFLLMVLLTVPNFASAYNYWTISANSSPAIPGAVTISGADYSVSGSTVNVVTSGVTTADFTVNPAPAGYALAYVTIDGVKYSAPNNGATYRVSKGLKINHTLSAVYSVKKYSVTTSKSGNGYIDPTVQVASGASRTVNMSAGLGYKIGAVSAGGAVLTAGDGVNSAAYTFSGVSENKSISVEFVPVPAVDAKIATSAQTIARGAALVIDGSASTASVPVTYSWAVLPATGATVTATEPGKASFSASAAGSYAVQLTVSADAQTVDTATVVINVSTPAMLISSACSTCHSTRDAANVTGYSASLHATNPYHAVSCQDCHTNGSDSMAVNAVETLCVTCHTAPYAPEYHAAVSATCSECHNVHSLAPLAGTSGVSHVGGAVAPGHAQYVSANVTCAACHAGSNPDILAEFKESAHGDPAGEAWAHYDWRSTARAACQRCHNGTVFAAKLNGASLNDSSNYFGATPPVAPGEVLNCSACHSDVSTGALRSADNQFTVNFSNGATVAYDVPGSSALCVRCHGGRESGDSIKLSSGNFANLSFINSHYLAAGGLIYNRIGYEFAGQEYDSLGYHRNVGNNNAFDTGSAGPCVACHMSAGQGHTWDFVTRDGNGHITANNSTMCVNCHAGLTGPALEAVKEEYEAALAALQTALAAKGILFYNAHPYFYRDLNGNGVYDAATEAGSSNAFKNWDGVDLNGAAAGGTGFGKDVMGAAFNFNLLEHDPGAWAHNKQYALKLIADSCDLLADGVVDGAGVPAAVSSARNSKEFAAATSHPAAIVAQPTSTNCAACHVPAPHYGGTPFHAAQYLSTASLPVSCADCHGEPASTSANQPILAQFAQSGHGDPAGEAWIHYDWRSGNRSSCARCHTGTAFVAKLGNENNTSNVFLSGDILKPGESLTCSACHTDAGAGELRAAAEVFTINLRNGATVTYDVAGASALCARCHSGRETGQSIAADTDATGIRAFVDSHYQPAAGTLYNKAGYEYAGQSYDSLGSHKLLGAAGQGPCVTCHMPGSNHSFVAASCGACHDGATAPLVDATNLKAGYDTALNDLKLALQAKGIHYASVHPFFYTAPYVAGGPNTPFTNWASVYGADRWKDTMGAAFNYNLLWSEKGASAHNYAYAMKLIADSIDFLSDGTVDGP